MRIRRIVRHAYLECGGDQERFEAACFESAQRYGFVITITMIAAFLQVCWLLYNFWKEFYGMDVPMSAPQNEPSDLLQEVE